MSEATSYSDQIERCRSLLRIRRIEERLMEEYASQEMRCPTYFSIGQEAVAVGVCAALRQKDLVFSAHRNHAHYLAKGGRLDAMVAELYGKATGCASGRGGSLHLRDQQAGFAAAAPIVGSTIALAAGFALSKKIEGDEELVVVFFGDGATETGIFYETLNFSVVQSLPIIFVCENNFYSIFSTLEPRQPKDRSISKLAGSIGLSSFSSDGQDVESVFRHAREAVETMRTRPQPKLLEFQTYRYVQHVGPGNDDHLGYREDNELQYWNTRDPLEIAVSAALASGKIGSDELEQWEGDISAEIETAISDAMNANWPFNEGLLDQVYPDSRPGLYV